MDDGDREGLSIPLTTVVVAPKLSTHWVTARTVPRPRLSVLSVAEATGMVTNVVSDHWCVVVESVWADSDESELKAADSLHTHLETMPVEKGQSYTVYLGNEVLVMQQVMRRSGDINRASHRLHRLPQR